MTFFQELRSAIRCETSFNKTKHVDFRVGLDNTERRQVNPEIPAIFHLKSQQLANQSSQDTGMRNNQNRLVGTVII